MKGADELTLLYLVKAQNMNYTKSVHTYRYFWQSVKIQVEEVLTMPGFGEKLSKFASNTKKQAQEMLETNKLKAAIRKEEESIKEAYSQIGQAYFDTYKEDSEIPANFRQMLNDVLGGMQRMEELKLQIQQLQGVRHCPQCGAETDIEKQFCGNCGYRFDNQPQVQPVVQQGAPVVTAATVTMEYEQITTQTEEPQPEATEGTWPPPGASAAPAQAEQKEKFCPSCGIPIAEGTKFCGNCGQKIG